jgi:hypothetical protein
VPIRRVGLVREFPDSRARAVERVRNLSVGATDSLKGIKNALGFEKESKGKD